MIISIVMLKIISQNDFDEFYQILKENFPNTEYRSYDEQKKLFLNKLYHAYGFYLENQLVATVALWDLNNFSYIEHLAVSTKHKNKGLGTKILKECIQMKDNTVILEVEPAIDDITTRRISFYERNGFALNYHAYKMPPLNNNSLWLDLHIMSYPNELTSDEFATVQKELYKKVYNLHI